jgi:hypothetical protein
VEKTGEKVVRVASSASLVAQWLEMRPKKEDKEASLWVNLSTDYKKEGRKDNLPGNYTELERSSRTQNLKGVAGKAV